MSLSVAALSLRRHLQSDTNMSGVKFHLGHPKSIPDEDARGTEQYINLFFYNVEQGGYPADTDVFNDDPFYVRFYCLLTAIGVDIEVTDENTVTAGENELRLITAVMQHFHLHPVLRIPDADEVSQLQIVPHSLSLDDINHIWSTQGDIPYRLSVAYEMALIPIPLKEKIESSSLVGAIGVEAIPNLDQEPLTEEGLGINARVPEVSKFDVDIKQPDWKPQICFLYQEDSTDPIKCQHSLAFNVDEGAVSPVQVWLAGKPGESVNLVWEVWKSDGWNRYGNPLSRVPHSTGIDPENTPPATSSPDPDFPIALPLPAEVDLAPDEYTGQAMLYAYRSYTPVASDQAIEIRSNPLLISLYRKRPAA